MIFKSIYLTFITQTQNPKDLNIKFLLLSTLSLFSRTPLKKIGASRRKPTLQGFNSDFRGKFVNKVWLLITLGIPFPKRPLQDEFQNLQFLGFNPKTWVFFLK